MIDQRTFEGLCEIQCTLEEIAGVLRVSEDTVERWCQRTYELGFADTYKKLSATGKTSLRRHQFELAKKGNATMLIWLGKQYLGQSDKPITEEHEEEANVDQLSKLLYSSVEEFAVREQISERDAALRFAEELADVPDFAAQLREWAVGLAPQQLKPVAKTITSTRSAMNAHKGGSVGGSRLSSLSLRKKL